MNIKLRLTLMNFLEFAVWGAYLTSMGNFLGFAGHGSIIGWFYSIQGIVSIFMPALMGIVADRWMQAQKLLSLCHLLAGAFMIAAGWYGLQRGFDVAPLFTLYTLSVAFYMPTLALSNSVAFNALTMEKLDTVKAFPPIRIFGTIGFIISMWIVDAGFAGLLSMFVSIFSLNWLHNMGIDFQLFDSSSIEIGLHGFFSGWAGRNQFLYGLLVRGLQVNSGQFIWSGVLSIVLAAYSMTLPACPVKDNAGKNEGSNSLVHALGLDSFKLFREYRMAVFFIFSMLLGVSLQITNGYANPFITSFKGISEFAHTFGAMHANILISISQISETCCILLIPFFLKKFGIKKVMMIAMLAWVLRFGFFGLGDTGPGVWMFILSCLVYGVAFDFFNVSGALYVDQNTDVDIRSSAQGLFMMMTNGLGATIGTLSAQAIVNHFVDFEADATANLPMWRTCWFIFSAYALIVLILFTVIFREEKVK